MWANKQPASEGGAETRTQMHVRVSPASTSRCRGLALHPLMLVSVPRARESRRRRAICGPIRIVRASAVFIPTPIHMVAKWQHQPVRTSTALHHYYSPPGQCTLKSLPLPSIPLLIHEHHGQQYTSRTPERFPAREISAPPPRGTDYFMGRDAWGAAPTEPMQAVWARPVAPTAEENAMHPLAETDGTVRARRQERLHRISFKAEQSSNGSLLYCTGYELQPHTRAGGHRRHGAAGDGCGVGAARACALGRGQPGLASLDCEGGASSERRAARPGLAAFGAHIRANGGGGGLFAPQGYTPSISEWSEENLDEWVEAGDVVAQESPRGGTWARKNSVLSEHSVGGGRSRRVHLVGRSLSAAGTGDGHGLGDAAPPSAPAPPQGGELAEEDPGAAERGADRSSVGAALWAFARDAARGLRGPADIKKVCRSFVAGTIGGLVVVDSVTEGREPAANAGWRLAFLLGFKLLLRLLLVVILVFVSTARPGIIRWLLLHGTTATAAAEEGELERRCGLGSSGSLALVQGSRVGREEVAAPARRTVEHCDCGGVGGETVLLLPHGRLRVVPCAAFVGAGAQEGLSLSVVRGGLALRRAARVVRPADGGQVDDAAQRGLGEHRVGRAARDAAGRLVPAGNIFAIGSE
ncbi:hypothetical protein B0H14DRAFT_2599203 [Mycena olivaceomarginata]|nr:hypothetical protein B0H14DRAFT_2599203 [Mycena olivaceomarginata]